MVESFTDSSAAAFDFVEEYLDLAIPKELAELLAYFIARELAQLTI